MNLAHRKAFEWLEAERDGRLEGPERRALRAHLAGCPDCRLAAGLAGRLEGEGKALPQPYFRPGGNEAVIARLVRVVQRSRRRQKFIREPLSGLAWAAAAVLLALVLSWAIESLRPGGAGGLTVVPSGGAGLVESGLRQGLARLGALLAAPVGGALGIDRYLLYEWVYRNFFLVGLTPLLLVALLGIILARRGEEVAWTVFLLGFLTFGVGIIYWNLLPENQDMLVLALLAIPFLAAAGAMLAVHLFSTPRQQSRWLPALALAWMGGLVLLATGPWYGTARNEAFDQLGLLFALLIGLIPALLWQAWEWRGARRWIYGLGLAFSLAALGFFWLDYLSGIPGRFPWLGVIYGPGLLLLLPISVILAVRLALARLPGRLGWQVWVAIAGLWLASFALVRILSIQTSTNEDLFTGLFLLFWADIAALMAAVASAWASSGRRKWAAVGMALLFAAALTPAAAVSRQAPVELAEARAGRINQAILKFEEENGRYPAGLEELAPRYLLFVPPLISYWQESWCYEAGESYYRLGYADPVYFTYPGEVKVRVFAGAGEIPDRPLPCDLRGL
jgi:hypothetical protein